MRSYFRRGVGIVGTVVTAVMVASCAPDVPPTATPIPTIAENLRPDTGTTDDLTLSNSEKVLAGTRLATGFIAMNACAQTDFHLAFAGSVKQTGESLGFKVQVDNANTDKKKQSDLIDQEVAQGAKLIVACELDHDSLLPALERAQAAGVVLALSGGDKAIGPNSTTFTLRNEDMGAAVGNFTGDIINKEMGGKANVIILDYPGVPATVVRADHMQTALHDKAPDASILGRYQGGTPENGEKSMTDALRQHPDLNVIMSINDAGAYGAVKALEASGKKPGDVIISSVDAQDQAKDFIRRGYFFRASLDTDPVSIGRYAVIAGVKMLAGSVVPRQILLKGLMVTAQTLGAATATTVPATAVATP